MSNVITEGSMIKCAHQGTVTPVGAAIAQVLRIGGKAVLVNTLQGSGIGPDCVQKPPPSSNQPCTSILAQSAGQSTVLFVGGRPVLLDTAAGTTDGKPANQWSVSSAGQSFVTAS